MQSISTPKECILTPGAGPAVFNGVTPNPSAWTILDLSPWVGSRRAFVLLNITSPDAGSAGYSIKNGGMVGEHLPTNFPADAGGCYSVSLEQDHYGDVCIDTSEFGWISWYCNLVDRTTMIRLRMFIA